MKKQFLQFFAMLVACVAVSSTVFAQGLIPSAPKYAILGSQATFSVTANAASTFAWSVVEAEFLADDSNWDVAGTTVVDGTTSTTAALVLTNHNTNAATVKFNGSPSGSNTMYAVQCEEKSADGCTTKRRFFVSVFDFEVDVQFVADASGTALTTPDDGDTDQENCNSWSGTLINNDHTAAEITAKDASLINNPTDNQAKHTSTFVKITLSLTNAPSGVTASDYKWRMQYSVPLTNSELYSLKATDALFSGEAGSASIAASATTDALSVTGFAEDGAFDQNNALYVAAGTTECVVEIQSHNTLGIANLETSFFFRVDQVQLENGTETDYNNGDKLASTSATSGRAKLTDGITGTNTINMSPATTVISIDD